MSNHFYSLNEFLRERHGEKIMKLSVDAGFTCPNRDGKVSTGGCLFCSSEGSGDFTFGENAIHDQLTEQIDLLSTKWPSVKKYIAYFQSYSNTYAPLNILKQKYETALSYSNVVGLAVGTRPDCLDPEVVEYLSHLHKRTHLWVELGLQTIHEETSRFLNRGHSLDCFTKAVYALYEKGIEVVAHIILGLPGETYEQMLLTAKYIASLPLQGVKIHMLHVVDNAPLYAIYQQTPFPLLEEKDYICLLAEILKILPSHFVIHRITGDADKKHLVAPLWTLNKRHVLNHFSQYMTKNQIYQGQCYSS